MVKLTVATRFLLAALVLGVFHLTFARPSIQAEPSREKEAQVDALFKRFGNSTPGCAVAIMNANGIVYSHAYGMADLEHGVPLTTDSIFSIDSMSKQFTGMDIAILAVRGRLSLQDDVHKYLPELPDYGHSITIAELLHHTSGLKDANELFKAAGFRVPFDIQTRKMYLDMVLRQRDLNFVPGSQFLYSDTNYFLLGMIIERVSGESLTTFTEHEIFAPLGMTHSAIRDDTSRIIERRAFGYNKDYEEKNDNIFHDADTHLEGLGADGVITSVEDFAKWDHNFYDAKVGGPQAIDLMLERQELSDGIPNNYSIGLVTLPYRGLKMVTHGGSGFGSNSNYVRFPDQQLSVVVLCNMRDLDPNDAEMRPGTLSTKIADIYLGRQFKDATSPSSSANAAVKSGSDAALLKALSGLYWDGAETVRKLDEKNGQLTVQYWPGGTPVTLRGIGGARFVLGDVTYAFDAERRMVTRLDLSQQIAPQPQQLVRVRDVRAGPGAMEGLAGTYYSRDIDSTWKIVVIHDGLVLQRKDFPDEDLHPAFEDAFSSNRGLLHFIRDARGRVTGLDLRKERLVGIRFMKCGGGPENRESQPCCD